MTKRQKPGIDLVIHGWLAQDPEFTTTSSGKSIVSWSISYKFPIKKTGEELVKWYNCKAFDALAEYIAEHYRARAFISAKVHYLSLWKDKNGNTREEYIISNIITEDNDGPASYGEQGGHDNEPPI